MITSSHSPPTKTISHKIIIPKYIKKSSGSKRYSQKLNNYSKISSKQKNQEIENKSKISSHKISPMYSPSKSYINTLTQNSNKHQKFSSKSSEPYNQRSNSSKKHKPQHLLSILNFIPFSKNFQTYQKTSTLTHLFSCPNLSSITLKIPQKIKRKLLKRRNKKKINQKTLSVSMLLSKTFNFYLEIQIKWNLSKVSL